MSFVSPCPKCQQMVTIPDGLDSSREVRCPLCKAEYPLGDAMATAPPALIPVAMPNGETSTPASATIGAAVHLDTAGTVAEVPLIDTGTTADSSAEAFSFASGSSTSTNATGREKLPPRPSRRRKKEKSLKRELLGVFVGGLLGLTLGYYLLNWLGGPRFDFLEVYLPGVPHTYQHGGEVDPEQEGEAPPFVPVDMGEMPPAEVTDMPPSFDFPADNPDAFTDPVLPEGSFREEDLRLDEDSPRDEEVSEPDLPAPTPGTDLPAPEIIGPEFTLPTDMPREPVIPDE